MLRNPDIAPPTLAVAICTAGRPAALATTLESLWHQTRKPAELIVIDDGRLDRVMLDGIAAHCEKWGIAFRYERKQKPGLTSSRNRAAVIATSEVIVYLDDDVTCSAGFLAETERVMSDREVGGVRPDVLEPAWSGLGSRLYQSGYALAGWWRIVPRRRPSTPPPAVARNGSDVRPTSLLSGAAMALRRDLVLANPFDERLTTYALGEDREMAYRLADRAWLVSAPLARVVHRRDAAGRTDARRFGYMTSYNYLYILRRHCRLRPGDYLLIAWSFIVLALMHIAYAIVGNRRAHLGELRGMADGLVAALSEGNVGSTPARHHASRPSVAATPRIRTRVLFVTNRLEHGGAEWMLLSLAKHLPAVGVQPAVICLKDAGPLTHECRTAGIPVFASLLHHKYDLAAIGRIRRLIERDGANGYNAIVAVGSGGDRMFWSTLAGHAGGVPVVVWSHWCPTPTEQRFELPNRLLYRWVDRFIALGSRHADALAEIERVPRGLIEIIHNGIDIARFDHADQRASVRSALGLAADDIAIAIVANLRREKRHDLFIEAARRLSTAHPRTRFFIIGDGPDRVAVHSAAQRSGLKPPTLQLLGPRDDMPSLYAGLDICCLCSDLECFSITMLESAASGCAFVGPDCGAMNEFLIDGVTGLATPPADAAALTAALDRLIRDPHLRDQIAANARKSVRAEFPIQHTAESFADLFSTLVTRRRFDFGRSRKVQ